jgi:hypothetical protein
MAHDMPETAIPDSSLGGAPRAESPATYPLGMSRPADRAAGSSVREAGMTGTPVDPNKARQRSRGDGVLPPGLQTIPASGQDSTRSRGVRVHRGEPLLLGVDEEYQITYRLFARNS